MGISDRMWEVVTRVIRMDDKVERLAETVRDQQSRIESLNERVIRLETTLELAMSGKVITAPRSIDKA
jgi:predicted RNase H-like nuclease (RuvC/YqgF family)